MDGEHDDDDGDKEDYDDDVDKYADLNDMDGYTVDEINACAADN